MKNLIINSNNGQQSLSFEVKDKFQYDSCIYIILNMSVENEYWSISSVKSGIFEDLVEDSSIEFKQICIPNTDWLKLSSFINEWIDKGKHFNFTSENTIFNNYLNLSMVGHADKYIVSKEKPLLKIECKANKLKIDYSLIVDRTSFKLDFTPTLLPHSKSD